MSEMKTLIADSACLIGLSRIGRLDVLHQLFGKIIIPEAVFHEVVILGKGRPGSDEVRNAKWIETRSVENQLAVRIFRLHLGAGESEAMALAFECGADFVILDDKKAREIAANVSLTVIIGTVALLNKASEKGIIGDLQSALEDLRTAGFRFDIA